MAAEHIFLDAYENYEQYRFSMADYVKQASTYLAETNEISVESAAALVKEILKESKELRNPIVKYRTKLDNGDMVETTDTLTDYIKMMRENNHILAPSYTAYVHPTVVNSTHSSFLSVNVNLRKSDKKAAFKAEQAGDTEKAIYYTVMQKTRKIDNNSLSGAYASASTILYNPSAHYTLTSITRCVASIGNAITESIVAGNKQFDSIDTVHNYIAAILSNINMFLVSKVVTDYNLHCPTANEVLEMILASSRYYWKDVVEEEKILQILSKLKPVHRAAIMYVNDMHHLRMHNETFVREMLTDISKKVTSGSTDNLADLNSSPEGVLNLVHHICAYDIRDAELKELNYEKMVGTPLLNTLASTARNINLAMEKYKIIFKTFFSTNVMPINIAYIKDMLRNVIVLSDTDSTCGSYDKWVEWYYGNVKFSEEAIGLAATVMTINVMAIDHNIRMFTKNMNIPADKTDLIKMKNEYFWPTFTAANVSKHYFADTLIQEMNVFKNTKLELKGVHLIASFIDQNIVKFGHDMIKKINETVKNGELIDMHSYVSAVADIERQMEETIRSGNIDIYIRDKIKEEKSYKLEAAKSPYLHHILWTTVFADKYGNAGEPTYGVIKVPTKLSSKRLLDEYIQSIEDPNIRSKMQSFITTYNKDKLGTFRPPASIVGQSGLPKEIIDAIDIKRIILDNCNLLYTVLESIGFYRKPSKLISEMGY